MKTAITTVLLTIAASQASAHAGHLADVAGAGHDHWIALGALGAAVAIALWAGLRGKKKDAAEEVQDEEPGEDELQEA